MLVRSKALTRVVNDPPQRVCPGVGNLLVMEAPGVASGRLGVTRALVVVVVGAVMKIMI